jgi:tol-pal system protein YbgF
MSAALPEIRTMPSYMRRFADFKAGYRRSLGALALIGLGLCAGASQAALFTDDEAHKKIAELQMKIVALEDRLDKVEKAQQNQGLVDLLAQVEALKADMAKLRGQIEVQSHDIESTQKRQKDFYVDLDTRMRRLETGPATQQPPAPAPTNGRLAPGAAGKGATGASQPTPAAAAPVDPAAETRAYEAALNLFKVGNYQGAIAAFDSFVRTYPNSNFASSSQYWIGNSYFALHNFKSAITAQQKLISAYPTSQKVPDAMLNIASSQQEMGDTAGARKTLEDIVAKYPLSGAAELAQKRLGNIK